jgi:hypothetical protein
MACTDIQKRINSTTTTTTKTKKDFVVKSTEGTQAKDLTSKCG